MTTDELEFSITQYLDGTLDEAERPAMEALLAGNAEARAVLGAQRHLTELLRSAPVPEVRWDVLSNSIAAAIDQQMEERTARASWWLRLRAPVGIAAAASVLLASAIAIHSLLGTKPDATRQVNPGLVATATPAMIVHGPQADGPEGPVAIQISIGPGGQYASEPSAAPYADDIDGQSSRVLVASGLSPEQTATVGFPF